MNASKTKWVRLGDYIKENVVRVGDKTDIEISGINIGKGFIPTVANMTSVDTSKYKIVPYDNFACNLMHVGRDVTIPLAYNPSHTIIAVSPAYYIFKIEDNKSSELLSAYLNMLLTRQEFGRLAWFHTDGSIRGNLPETSFHDIQIPLPPIEVQRELVDTYNGLKTLAEQNEALVTQLSKMCEALVVETGKKYEHVTLGDYIENTDERNMDEKYTLDDVRGVSTDKEFIATKANMSGVSVTSYKVVHSKQFVYVADTSRRGDKIALALNQSDKPVLVSSIYTAFKTKEALIPEYLYLLLSRTEFDRYTRFNSWGSARETFDWAELCRVQIPLPPIEAQQSIVNLYHCMEEAKSIAATAREQLKTICPALVLKGANA